MTEDSLVNCWATRFGLAAAPLFEEDESSVAGSHHVLLDGGYGSFALSVSEERIWKQRDPANWSWSSDLPHHVTVTGSEVAVIRWDKPTVELLTRSSVESQIEAFYVYLTSDRVKSSQRVVDHMLTIFRRVRSLVADARIADDRSVDAFLAFIAHAIERSRNSTDGIRTVSPSHLEGEEVLRSLSKLGVESLFETAWSQHLVGQPLTLFPELAVRHAGSEIFQEAHFELLRAPGPDLFGYAGPAETRQVTRGGTHFTPPALARSIVEQSLAQIPDLASRQQLIVLDPACGSGAFLHEALRTLRRSKFEGHLVIIGRDTSRSAISMARFALNNARADWSPAGGCDIDLAQGDSLTTTLPVADIVLMNPPFVAWPALTAKQRQQMQDILGHRLEGRGDFSMAFVTRALEILAPGGVLGTLLPASLLTLQAAEAWRKDLLDRADLRFIASLGDYSLFAYALVQIAAVVLCKPRPAAERLDNVAALVTANDPEATGNALRNLRRADPSTLEFTGDGGWQLFQVSARNLRQQATWRLTSPRTEKALRRIVDVGRAAPIGRLFDVRQGVRTGMNPVFLLAVPEVDALPFKERKWFRPAVMNESINNGQIDTLQRIFYPYDREGLAIKTEDQLRRLVPAYFEQYLLPARERLERRASIVQANRLDWWGLSRHRGWALDTNPRLVSKYFGGPGGFATDLEAQFIVVQGFAWFPKWSSTNETDTDADALPLKDILAAYMAIMNSRPFGRLLEIFSPHVAGGQFDLSPRHVNAIPIPDLSTLANDEHAGLTITRLASLGGKPRGADEDWRVAVDRLTTELYGVGIFDQV
jgi:adenine-specific DNA-methyltransferase